MTAPVFSTPAQSHAHSLRTLQSLYEYDDFMLSISTMADMGYGSGLDLEWWATRTTRDDSPQPLNIRCVGYDLRPDHRVIKSHPNITYQHQDFESEISLPRDQKFDLVWCHSAWQYVIDPFGTLRHWWQAMNPDAMLIISVPQTTNLEFNKQAFDQRDGVYYNWTVVSLIHVMATSGFDCRGGFFYKDPADPWLHAAVYRSATALLDPRTTRWYDLDALGLLPDSASSSVNRHGYLRQRDLVLPWFDKMFYSWAEQ